MKKVLPIVIAIGLLLAACGPQEAATLDPVMVQQTAVAMAFTMSAQTQAAMPTNTPVPPTATATIAPPPSPTFPALPTFPAAQATATTASTTGGACNSLMAPNWSGPEVYVLIDNQTKAPLSFSLYLNETAFACGFARLPAVGPNANVGVHLPAGCYWPSAYVNDPKKPRAHEGPLGCLNGDDKITIVITYDGMRWVWP